MFGNKNLLTNVTKTNEDLNVTTSVHAPLHRSAHFDTCASSNTNYILSNHFSNKVKHTLCISTSLLLHKLFQSYMPNIKSIYNTLCILANTQYTLSLYPPIHYHYVTNFHSAQSHQCEEVFIHDFFCLFITLCFV